MGALNNHRVAILVTDGFEQSELAEPKKQLEAAGAKAFIIAPEGEEVRGWRAGEWGDSFAVDKHLADVKVDDFEGLVLPGGQINPDILRNNDKVVSFIRAFAESGKPVAAICHGPWTLIEADLVSGRKVTSYPSIRTDLRNAGANWVDEEVVVDDNLITSRKPEDLDAFCGSIIEALQAVDATESRAS